MSKRPAAAAKGRTVQPATNSSLNFPLLKSLSEVAGVPGREERVRDILRREADPLFDAMTVDAMGNLIATKHAAGRSAKRVLFACHMDEIGFYVRHIDDHGFVRVTNFGGFDTRNLLARRVIIQTKEGDLPALMNPGGRPLHIAKDEDRKKIPEVGEFYLDCCLPADDVKRRVRIGDPVTLVQECIEIGQCVSGKAMDNRVAGFVLIEAMKKVTRPKYETIVAFTVQEEVGLRGAGPAAFGVDPDIAIAVDTTLCVDTPGVPEDERVTKQGGGVALKIADSASISDRELIDELEALAKAKNIPHQLSLLPRGGTDAAAMQRARGGVRAATIAVPTRYIHTVTEAVHKTDLQAAIDLVAAWLQA